MTRILTLLAALLIVLAIFFTFREQTEDAKTTPPSIEMSKEDSRDELNFHEWKEFSLEQDQFKVLLPALPQHVSDTIVDPKTQEQRKYETFATAAPNGTAFIINVISLPESSIPSEESLKAIVTDMLERNKENKLNYMKMGSLKEKPTLDFSLLNNDVLIEGKVLALENKMYIMSMMSKEASFNKKEFDFFVNSFEFISDKPNANEPEEEH